MTLQGHPRSMIFTPVKSLYGISDWSSTVTLDLSFPVSVIFTSNSTSFHTPPLFRSKFRGVPFGGDPWCWSLQRDESSHWSDMKFLKNSNLNVTDGQTTCRSNIALCVAFRVKNLCRVKVKLLTSLYIFFTVYAYMKLIDLSSASAQSI